MTECLKTARYAHESFKSFRKHLNKIIKLSYTPLTFRFKKPNDDIVYKYTLVIETLNYTQWSGVDLGFLEGEAKSRY